MLNGTNYFAVRIIIHEDGRRNAVCHTTPDKDTPGWRIWILRDISESFEHIIRSLLVPRGDIFTIKNPGDHFTNEWFIWDNREA